MKQSNLLTIYLVIFLIFSAKSASAEFILSIGTTPLANNSADARLPIYATWNGVGQSTAIGMQLSIGLGDTTAAQTATPFFRGTQGTRQGINLLTTSFGNTIWQTSFIANGSNDTIQFGSAPESGNFFRASNVGITDLSGLDFADFATGGIGPKLIAELRLNITGISNQSFAITIGNIGNATSFIADGINNQAVSFSGTFDVGVVTAVPEPNSLLLAFTAGLGAIFFQRRRSSCPRRR